MPRKHQPALGRLILAPTLGLLSACHAQAGAPVVRQGDHAELPMSCGPTATLRSALVADLMRGTVPEASRMGQCVAKAARQGDVPAAMLLADVYRQAMSAVEGTGTDAGSGRPALRIDLFGRHIGWLHIAADRRYSPAQLLMAQETDGAAWRPMPDTTLAWYQAAAEGGSGPALAAIGLAYSEGRIRDERLHDLKIWLSGRSNPGPAVRQVQRLLQRNVAAE